MSQRATSAFLASGSESAGGVEFSKLYSKLARAVRATCPSWLQSSADDIVQSAMVRVIKLVDQSEGKREFKTSYLWKVAYSALVDEIRRHRRRQEVEFDEQTAEGRQLQSQHLPNPEQQARAREEGEMLRSCLGQLLKTRKLAVVAYLQGHTVPETARLLGWTAKRAENLVYRGLSDLRECLRTKGVRA